MALVARLVIDDFVEREALQAVLNHWPSPTDKGWKHHNHSHVKNKRAMGHLPSMPEAARKLLMRLNSQQQLDDLTAYFGINLIPDPWIVTQGSMFGGGLHETEKGGFLATHVDYNRHAGVYRRLNLLLYLNDWKPGDGGELLLNDEVIEPIFNRCVVFETTEDSWHGHPNPWNADTSRKSLAVYYYSGTGEDVPAHNTIYKEA
jgi:Rps23 Pro-64 3,4-dihydroxylase Tpa1-like proline 4-hydroxylase